MKIELYIPEWAKEKNIYLFAGQELIAYKEICDNKFKVKFARCNGCGQCCESGSPFDFSIGPCPHITPTGCGLGKNIPFSCARSDCSKKFDKCSERFD